jgi:hypothetical protein
MCCCQSLADFYEVRALVSQRFPLRSGFSVNAGFESDWDNQPAEDAGKSDYRYILSLGYGL